MSDIFISYAKENKHLAEALARALTNEGFSVWWDYDIPIGGTFDEVIEKALYEARCIVVIWTEHSVKSRWVRTEASIGMERNILVPVCFGGAEPPLAFRLIQTASLDGWPENSKHPGYLMFLRSIRVITGHSAKYTTQTSVPTRHQKTQEISWGKILLISIALIVMIFSIVTILDKFTTSRELGIGGGNPSLTIEIKESTPNTTIPHYLDPSLWFPTEANVNQGLIATEIERVIYEVANLPEWGRLDTFVRSFNHPHLCGSSDLHRVFIQITFFETQTGAEAFYHWAHEGADVQFKDYVGDNAYIYKELDSQRPEEDCRVDYYSLSFQRANVFTRVRVQAIPGKLSFDEMREIAKPLAILIDQHYLNYLEQ